MDVTVVISSFVLLFLAEMGDKTQLMAVRKDPTKNRKMRAITRALRRRRGAANRWDIS
jgi:hypothetical protein